MSRQIPFTKMVGTGNDFLIVDARRHALASLRRQWHRISAALCHRRNGIGADGLLLLEPSRTAHARMRVFNADGSEAEMCGNGIRCVARYLSGEVAKWPSSGEVAKWRSEKDVRIETKAGILTARVKGERVAVAMTEPTQWQLGLSVPVASKRIRVDAVNTGVPHAVVRVADVDAVDVERLGRALRRHPQFAPKGTNVDFAQSARRPNRIRLRTYERGVEGETPACGTGVTAAAVLHVAQHAPASNGTARAQRVEVEVRSGDVLTVSCTVRGHGAAAQISDVVLEGPAQRICDGTVTWPLGGAR